MQRENLSDLLAFIAVARDRSFTRAAAKLGVSLDWLADDALEIRPTESAGKRARERLAELERALSRVVAAADDLEPMTTEDLPGKPSVPARKPRAKR